MRKYFNKTRTEDSKRDEFKDILMGFKQKLDMGWYEKLAGNK